jgi:hypothetical protein
MATGADASDNREEKQNFFHRFFQGCQQAAGDFQAAAFFPSARILQESCQGQRQHFKGLARPTANSHP